MPLARDHWVRRIGELDPEADCVEVYRITVFHEFPWDVTQALGLAFFRTYAVPSIGALLARTGELTGRTQRRYDDTGLILEAVLEHGFASPEGRAGVRRMNQMHGAWDVGADDLRYVLGTFVSVPIRWVDAYGYRPLLEAEKVAMAAYFRRLGALMNIPDVPQTWQDFLAVTDAYEAEHYGYDAGGRAVADATVDLMSTFAPVPRLSAPLARRVALALMDDPLLDAFGYPHPPAWERTLVRSALRARGRLLRHAPARRVPTYFRQRPQVRSHPDGFDVAELGTFPERS